MEKERLFFDPENPNMPISELLEKGRDISDISSFGIMIKDAMEKNQKIYEIIGSVFPKMQQIAKIEVRRSIDCQIEKDGKYWFSWCPQLDIASQGRTTKEAINNLRASIEIFLEDDDSRIHRQSGVRFFQIEIREDKSICHDSHLCHQVI
jgi:predicted RNase H-like HicB family nuclease